MNTDDLASILHNTSFRRTKLIEFKCESVKVALIELLHYDRGDAAVNPPMLCAKHRVEWKVKGETRMAFEGTLTKCLNQYKKIVDTAME